jgi:hypothetical protein
MPLYSPKAHRHADQGFEAEGLIQVAQTRHFVIKNIHFTNNEDKIEGRTEEVKGLVLRTKF